ncbi:uncharacterized protein LOC111480805 isoform X3 [Cucurbita maxima]|uniref:Uncharacterized protein LOC111480805 isoform X3 n=1 Tax=Cucurbita maxima TaxID=3661 RepID=A0A6J1IUU7_CUCMA|nr:uncharacterized protein LOC111480805 isoform X3 [Cucurbita maxima]
MQSFSFSSIAFLLRFSRALIRLHSPLTSYSLQEKLLACSLARKVVVVVLTSVSFHLNIFWTTSMWIIAFVSLLGRIVVALQRERQLQQNLQFLEIEFENVLWERKEFQKHFQAAMKEQKVVELMLDELEMIHEKATGKISHLESELHKLRNENLRLQEIKGKTCWQT